MYPPPDPDVSFGSIGLLTMVENRIGLLLSLFCKPFTFALADLTSLEMDFAEFDSILSTGIIYQM